MPMSFRDKITEILDSTGPEILRDRNRFLSAIQDAGIQYSKERKLLSRYMDDNYFMICTRAAGSSVEQIPHIRQQATEYLIRESMAPDKARYISDALVTGIGAYFHGPDVIIVGPIPPDNQNNMIKKILVICAAIALGLIIGLVVYMGMNGSDTKKDSDGTDVVNETQAPDIEDEDYMTIEDIDIERFDINFSQITNQSVRRNMYFDKDGVDVLIRVKNNNKDEILRGFAFKYKQAGRDIQSVTDDEDKFYAYGLIQPGETGYMYSKIRIPNYTDTVQGDIQPVEIISTGNPDNYDLGTGTMGNLNDATDAYDVTVINNTANLMHKGATVVAVEHDSEGLAGEWGAGVLDADIAPSDRRMVKNALYNPGLEKDNVSYDVFVIDTYYLK